jgi:hypothetical protein
MKFPCLQEMPPTEPVEQGDEGEWDTVGEAAGSHSPTPTVEELLAQMERQPPAAQGSTEPATAAAEEAAATEAQAEAPAEAGLVDITSILGAPNCDGGPVKLVSVDSSRVVHDVVVVLD